ncbi:hypothetical protein V6N12_044670 [Hibiscus sabdariffa]|uniref:Uncharacterized protein n=1 Tax=Hibiscus sabdariffa TaxID=183260 RepID=A0ABR2AXH7_9ROSI
MEDTREIKRLFCQNLTKNPTGARTSVSLSSKETGFQVWLTTRGLSGSNTHSEGISSEFCCCSTVLTWTVQYDQKYGNSFSPRVCTIFYNSYKNVILMTLDSLHHETQNIERLRAHKGKKKKGESVRQLCDHPSSQGKLGTILSDQDGPTRSNQISNHALITQPQFINQTWNPVSLELKDTEVRAYRTDPVQVRSYPFYSQSKFKYHWLLSFL